MAESAPKHYQRFESRDAWAQKNRDLVGSRFFVSRSETASLINRMIDKAHDQAMPLEQVIQIDIHVFERIVLLIIPELA